MVVRQIKYFVKENGKSPFEDWFNKLDSPVQAVVARVIQRVAKGEAKKSIKALKNRIFEIRIPKGPGYRVYFTEDKESLMILLLGGDKKTQSRNIDKAKKYWRDYGKQT